MVEKGSGRGTRRESRKTWPRSLFWHRSREDEAESFKWYFEASKSGHVESIYNVGVAYANGDGVSIDKGKAFSYFKKAAELGHVSAQQNLALAYSKGDGCAIDLVSAFTWYKRAADQGEINSIYARSILCFWKGRRY